MPKQSKITSSKPGKPAPIKDEPTEFHCSRCARVFKKQKNNFFTSQSSIYLENFGHFTVCRHCMEEMFNHYKEVLGGEKPAVRRMCMKFDIYWNEDIYNAVTARANAGPSRISSYISKVNLYQWQGKTFDDTLDEEAAEAEAMAAPNVFPVDPDIGEGAIEIPEEWVAFWGTGFELEFYQELESRYNYWCGDVPRSEIDDVDELAVIRQICILEVTINRDVANGKSIDKSVNALNNLLGTANRKPVQKKKDDGSDAGLEMTPFGVWIKKIENTRPISEPEPEFKDVDGIFRYITTWFLGHFCKMTKKENKYAHLYDEEMARLRVDRPEYEDLEDEDIVEDMFARGEGDEEAEVMVDGDGD